MDNSLKNREPLIDRRQFFKTVAKGGALSAGVFGALNGLQYLKSVELSPLEEEIKVKDFNMEIINHVIEEDFPNKRNILALYSLPVGFQLSFLRDHFNEPIKSNKAARLANTGLAASLHVADLYSTAKGLSSSIDPRFKEYGFNEIFTEVSPVQPKEPTKKDLISRGVFTTSIFSFLTYKIPALVGFYFPLAGPIIYKNNFDANKIFRQGYDIGDKVKELIQEGKNREEIYDFIDAY